MVTPLDWLKGGTSVLYILFIISSFIIIFLDAYLQITVFMYTSNKLSTQSIQGWIISRVLKLYFFWIISTWSLRITYYNDIKTGLSNSRTALSEILLAAELALLLRPKWLYRYTESYPNIEASTVKEIKKRPGTQTVTFYKCGR